MTDTMITLNNGVQLPALGLGCCRAKAAAVSTLSRPATG